MGLLDQTKQKDNIINNNEVKISLSQVELEILLRTLKNSQKIFFGLPSMIERPTQVLVKDFHCKGKGAKKFIWRVMVSSLQIAGVPCSTNASLE